MTEDMHDDRHAWERPGAFEVAPGIHRIPLPLPGDGLKAVNVYAIEQGDGLTMIDSGWALGEARSHLEAGLAQIGHDLGDITRFLVTHIHRDHYEQAIRVREIFGSRVALGTDERPALEALRHPRDENDPGMMTERLRTAGADALIAELEEARRNRRGPGDIQWELPDEWLTSRQILDLDGRTLEVVATPGHTRGHVVFLDRDAELLFAGDHVLPHITPSIGFEAVPAASPLADYLASLALVRALPDCRLLPAHGPVRPDTHRRIDELVAHHDDRLDLSQKAVGDGASTGAEVAAVLPWTRHGRAYESLDVFNRMLAVNETVAHLDVLVTRGRLGVAVDEAGVRHYHV